MELDSEHFAARESILCQNCGQPVPDWAYGTALEVIGKIKKLPDSTDGEAGKGFYLSAKVIPPYYTNPVEED